jgi:hypothetical protein
MLPALSTDTPDGYLNSACGRAAVTPVRGDSVPGDDCKIPIGINFKYTESSHAAPSSRVHGNPSLVGLRNGKEGEGMQTHFSSLFAQVSKGQVLCKSTIGGGD